MELCRLSGESGLGEGGLSYLDTEGEAMPEVLGTLTASDFRESIPLVLLFFLNNPELTKP